MYIDDDLFIQFKMFIQIMDSDICHYTSDDRLKTLLEEILEREIEVERFENEQVRFDSIFFHQFTEDEKEELKEYYIYLYMIEERV